MMIEAPATTPKAALVVAECQLVLLGELAAMAMVVSRAFAASAVSAAQAEQMILAEEYFTPEVGRARACGAKDAAESFQKVSRAVRLTMRLELALAETVDALREGRAVTVKDAGETPAVLEHAVELDRRRLAGSPPPDDAPDDAPDRDRRDPDREGLVEFDRPDALLAAPFRDTVEQICEDLGATVDWTRWRIEGPSRIREAVRPSPPDRRRDRPAATDAELAIPP